MKLITGDECGLLKECLPSPSQRKDKKNHSTKLPVVKDEGIRILNDQDRLSRQRGVVGLAWSGCPPNDGGGFASLRMDGSVQLWERREPSQRSSKSFAMYRQVADLQGVFQHDPDDASVTPQNKPLGLASFRCDNGNKSLLAACNARGQVSVIEDKDSVLSIAHRFSTLDTQGQNAKASMYPLVGCMGVHESNAWIGVGGKDRETTIYDLESSKRVWKAKNLPPHPQTLLQPIVWPSALSFLKDGHRLVVGSDLQVRLYDVRVDSQSIQRRPVAHTPPGLLEQRVTALCQSGDDTLIVGDTAGYIYTLDLRNLSNSLDQARFVGPAGSIRQLVQHSSLPRMAAVGLDRMLRLYDVQTRKQTSCLYLKQRLNCVLFDNSVEDRLESSEVDGDDVFDGTEGDLDQEDFVQDYSDSDKDSDVSDNEDSPSVDKADEPGTSDAEDQESSDAGDDGDLGASGDSDDLSDEPRKKQRR